MKVTIYGQPAGFRTWHVMVIDLHHVVWMRFTDEVERDSIGVTMVLGMSTRMVINVGVPNEAGMADAASLAKWFRDER